MTSRQSGVFPAVFTQTPLQKVPPPPSAVPSYTSLRVKNNKKVIFSNTEEDFCPNMV